MLADKLTEHGFDVKKMTVPYIPIKNLNKFTTFTFVAVSILTHALSVFIFWEILYAGPTVALTLPFPISLQESITIPLIYSCNIIFCIFTGGLIIKNLKKLSISN